ncbi:DNA replication protein DnaD [Bacillus sp. FJAT-18017]|uniref:DnaD domain-containing protein n=1 Tax=Bacillus sp. FJAT-18017 TaxID=1705566 RepID=UPI0006ADD9AC|nr:DnaD domain-containing protein [Bacillus sp. FJAT-18017]ALC90144.1 DNA replication protein DnaD [Bacillus sp. FJAT-18017]
MKSSILGWMHEGNVTIPSLLFTEYKNLNLNEYELVLLLNILNYAQKGNEFPTPEQLSSHMTLSDLQCTDALRKLIQRGYIEIMDEYSPDGIRCEKYSLEPLWQKLIDQFLLKEKADKEKDRKSEEQNLYTIFEKEFGRPLSPFECETLAMWVDDDKHGPQIIKAALREAVMSGKLNFRYIDRILFEWKKNGIKTIEQAKNQSIKFRQRQQAKNLPQDRQAPPVTAVPFYNWLEQ